MRSPAESSVASESIRVQIPSPPLVKNPSIPRVGLKLVDSKLATGCVYC